MSVLIKGLKMPEDGALLCLKIYPSGVVRTCFGPPQPPDSKIATAIPVSDHGDLLEELPTIEPTLYGYNLKHLALIAHEMEEKGVTADKAAEIFADASAVVQMVLDEQKKAIDAEVKRWMT